MKLAVALLLATWFSSATAAYDIQNCSKFAELGFNNLDFDRYDIFYMIF